MDGMRRDLFRLGGVLGVLGLMKQANAEAIDHTPAGSWMVQIEYDNTTNNLGSQAAKKSALCQFFDDGRWFGSVSAVNPDSSESWPSNWRQLTYHGEWKRHGHKVTIVATRLRIDDMGTYVANATTTIQATLAPDGQSWTGTFKTTSRSATAAGNFTGSVSGMRM